MKSFEVIKKYSSLREFGTAKYLYGLISFKNLKNEMELIEMCYGCITGSEVLNNNTYLIEILNKKLSYFDINKNLTDDEILNMVNNWKSIEDVVNWYTSYLINITMLKEKWISRTNIDFKKAYIYYLQSLRETEII